VAEGKENRKETKKKTGEGMKIALGTFGEGKEIGTHKSVLGRFKKNETDLRREKDLGGNCGDSRSQIT